jgi:hypothetical protein
MDAAAKERFKAVTPESIPCASDCGRRVLTRFTMDWCASCFSALIRSGAPWPKATLREEVS